MKRIAITGSAGNLGSLLARHMIMDNVKLHLLIHKKDVEENLKAAPNAQVFRINLNDPSTVIESLRGVDTVIHFAGVLFQSSPEKFLPKTNIGYFENLLTAASTAGVKRVILISFPHVEGESSPENPAIGRLDGKPDSVHAATRLEEEKLLLSHPSIQGVSLRCGMVYGKGILMIEGARIFSKLGILGIWKQPTHIHLISREDFVAATAAAAYNDEVRGIYHLGDEGVQSLQEFLQKATEHWGTRAAITMPIWMINTAAWGFECASAITGCKSPLTRDFVKIGQASYYGDCSRMRAELLAELRYRTISEGIHTLS